MKRGYVYLLASKKDGVLYVGVTSNLEQRILQHKNGTYDGFTKKYFIHKLIWFQEFPSIEEAIQYEKILKGRKRYKKIKLVEEENKNRMDLFEEFTY